VAADDRPTPRRVELLLPTRTLLKLALFGLFVALVVVALDVLLSIFVAIVLALGLDPVVGALVRRGWGRGRAALVVFAALYGGAALILLITIGPLWEEVREFAAALPAYWDQISQSDAFEALLAGGGESQIKSALEDIARELPDAATTLLGVAGGIFGSVLSLVTLTFLALFMLIERHTITAWLFGFARPEVEARWHPVLEDSISAVSSSLIGNVAISLVAATVAGVSALAFGLPFPIVLAVLTGFLDLIPQVGATIAAVILVLVGLTVSTEAAIAMAIIQIIYQQLENYVVYPIVYRRAVELSPFTTIVAVLIASSILGVLGAILAVPFAAVIKSRCARPPARGASAWRRSGPSPLHRVRPP
jgi:predicted PurR-regulated permease PerM